MRADVTQTLDTKKTGLPLLRLRTIKPEAVESAVSGKESRVLFGGFCRNERTKANGNTERENSGCFT